jgi:general secretion pathway protein D
MSNSPLRTIAPAWFAALLAFGLGVQSPAYAQDDPPPDDEEEFEDGPMRPMPMLPGPAGPLRRGMPGPSRKPIGGQDGSGDGDDPPPPPPPAGEDEDDAPAPKPKSSSSNGSSSSSSSSNAGGDDEDGEAAKPDEDRQRPPVLDPNAKVSVDFVDADINDIIKYMAEITGRNFILGDKLSGSITIISHQQVTVAEAYEAFLSALEVSGYTTVTVGKATKVVKSGEASKTPLRVYHGDVIPYTDNFVTQIINLENVSVKDISSVVKDLLSGNGRVIAYSPTNTLIITDAAVNIRRVYGIINELDVASPKSTIEIVILQYAEAAEVETILEEMYSVEGSSSSGESDAQSAAARRRAQRNSRRNSRSKDKTTTSEASATNVGEGSYISKIISDERTNSLIIQANTEAMESIMDLVAKLDVDVDPSSRSQIHVIYLEHAKAEDVAQVLSNLANSSSSSSSSSRTGRSSQQRGRDSRGAVARPGTAGAADETGSSGAVAAFDSGMRVASDENTNSLVIIASPEDFRIIKQVIDKLDIRRKQVFVEVVILEMASEDTFDFGLGYHTGAMGDDGNYSVYSAQLNGSSMGLTTDALSGLAMGVFGQSMSLSVGDGAGGTYDLSVPVFGVALNALQGNSSVNIISTPNVLTTDNEEAKFVVGRNIPFPVSTGRDSNNNPIVSYQREDVATTLKVTPQINESNFVTLEVYQEVQEIEEDSQGLDVNSAGFITSKRSAETTVVVRDNQTVVLGGLIGNTDTEVESKIPLLGDLPLIGALFRGRRTVSRKTNLLIFLTPHVIDGPEDLEEVYRVKVAQRNEFIRRFYGKSKEEQEIELAKLLQYSMNVVDEPSVYRTKVGAASNVTTITGTGEVEETPRNETPADTTTPPADPQPDDTGASDLDDPLQKWMDVGEPMDQPPSEGEGE